VKQNVPYTVLHADSNNVESIWIKLIVNKCNVGIGCVYRPPTADHVYYDNILNQIEQVKAVMDDLILMGDLNYNYNKEGPSCPIQYIEVAYGLHQLVTQPTRITETSSTLLDVILSSMPEQHICTNVLPVALSDHHLVYTDLKYCFKLILKVPHILVLPLLIFVTSWIS
jgi:hypothetical protein